MNDMTGAGFGDLDRKLMVLARECAMNIHPPEKVCSYLQISSDEYQTYTKLPRFQALFEEQNVAWNTSLNTKERTIQKYWSMLEMSQDRLFARLVDPKENLAPQVELTKVLHKAVGLGVTAAEAGGTGEKFVLNLNFSSGRQLRIERDIGAQQHIEGELVG